MSNKLQVTVKNRLNGKAKAELIMRQEREEKDGGTIVFRATLLGSCMQDLMESIDAVWKDKWFDADQIGDWYKFNHKGA